MTHHIKSRWDVDSQRLFYISYAKISILFHIIATFANAKDSVMAEISKEKRSKMMAAVRSKRHKARTDGKEVPLAPRLQVQAEPEPIAWTPRHRVAQIPHVHLREWLLLAWSRLQGLPHAEDPCGVLGE